jgi:DNA-binding transcriptional MerR regulator
LYRELGLPLDTIKNLLDASGFDRLTVLEEHLEALQNKRDQLETIIRTVRRSITAQKGEQPMSTKEQFEGFKQKKIDENEERYGAEVRMKYGDKAADESNRKFAGLSPEEFARLEEVQKQLNDTLARAFAEGDPTSELAREACALHKEWLCFFWPRYSPEAHKGVTQMYVDDPRFTAHYDAIAPGCAVFLRDAVHAWC